MELKIAEYSDYQRIAQLQTHHWQTLYHGMLDEEYLQNDILEERALIWQTRLLNPSYNQHILLLEHQNELCGFICAFGNHDYEKGSMIDSLYVASEYQAQGLEHQLILAMTEWLERYFADGGVYIEVVEKNAPAIAFYTQMEGKVMQHRHWKPSCGGAFPEVALTWPSPQHLRHAIASIEPADFLLSA